MTNIYVNPPTYCDLCRFEIKDEFWDGRAKNGKWVNMCHFCFLEKGVINRLMSHYKRNAKGFFVEVK